MIVFGVAGGCYDVFTQNKLYPRRYYRLCCSRTYGTHATCSPFSSSGSGTNAECCGRTACRRCTPFALRSFAADAVENSTKSSKHIAAVTPVEAKRFLLASTDAKSRTENRSDVSTNVRYESNNTVTFSLETKPASGGSAGAVHTGTIVK